MRSSRVLGLLFVVVLFVAAAPVFAEVTTPDTALRADLQSSTPSKVCHPKKPITCHAADVSLAPSSDVPPVAMLCLPPRFLCRAGGALDSNSVKSAPEFRFEFHQAMLCLPPRFLCRASTFN